MSEILGKSPQGRSIHLHKLGTPSAPTVLLVGGVHGDEPEGVWLVDAFLQASQSEHSQWKCSVWVIPNINPDGAAQQTRTNGRGVDLNRNFPAPDWTQEAKAPRYYPGDSPASEVETQLIMKVIAECKPVLLVHCHSWVPQICYTGARARPWAEILARGTGYPATEDIGYPTPGSLGQYGWYGHKIPVICIEMQEGAPQEKVIERGLGALLNLFRQDFSKAALMTLQNQLAQVKAFVFDLDDTLFDTYGLLVKKAAQEAVTAMIQRGFPLQTEEAFQLREKLFRENPRANVYLAMCKTLRLSDAASERIAAAGFKAFHDRDVEKHIIPFASVPHSLERLKKRHRLFLVTVGTPSTQRQKVQILGLEEYFERIWCVDVKRGHSKSEAYQELLQLCSLPPERLLSVGNRIDSEIRDSKELGMLTCLMLHGEYLHLKPASPLEIPDFEIKDIEELITKWAL